MNLRLLIFCLCLFNLPHPTQAVCVDKDYRDLIQQIKTKGTNVGSEAADYQSSIKELGYLLGKQETVAQISTTAGAVGAASGAIAATMLAVGLTSGAAVSAAGAQNVTGLTFSEMLSMSFGRLGAIPKNDLLNTAGAVTALSTVVSLPGRFILWITNPAYQLKKVDTPTGYILSESQIARLMASSSSAEGGKIQIWRRILAGQHEKIRGLVTTLQRDKDNVLKELNTMSGLRADIERITGRRDLNEIELMLIFNKETAAVLKEYSSFLKSMETNLTSACAAVLD